jgi:uncharacterized protein
MLRPVATLLWNPTERRVRAAWRVIVPLVLVLAGVVAADLVLLQLQPVGHSAGSYLMRGAARVAVVLGVVVVTVRLLDRRRLGDYGLRGGHGWWADLLVGAVIGLAMFAASTAAAVAAGWIEVQAVLSPAASGRLWLPLVAALFNLAGVSLWEELLFRGVMIKNGTEGLSGRWPVAGAVTVATTISTVVFAVIHVPQHLGAGMPMGSLAVMWVSLGTMLALGYVLTGSLALPLGLHLTINLALQHVFALGGEFQADAPTILQLEVVGPDRLAGIGGWLQFAAVVGGAVALLAWIRWRRGGLRIDPSFARGQPVTVRDAAAGDRDGDRPSRCRKTPSTVA